MRAFSVSAFKGLDTRLATAIADPQTARVAKNVYLSKGRTWKTRPGSRKILEVPPESRGLYAVDGVLRAVAPQGNAALWAYQRPNFWLDFVEGSDAIDEYIDAEIYGVPSAASGAQPYLAIRRGNQVQHHWVKSRLDNPGDAEVTRVFPGFVPSGGLIKLAQKIFALDNSRGAVRFSSTAFGPDNWTEELDAGILPVQQHGTGDLQVRALGIFQGRLVVFFDSQIQIWAVDPQPENFFLVETMNGPGTAAPALVEAVLGDIFFFSRGGFRSLTTQRITGETLEGDIGAPIASLTDQLDPATATHGVWWQRLSLYVAAFGSRCFVFTYDRAIKVTGWAEWEFPFEVERFVVVGDRLYARSRDAVYEISDYLLTDDNGADIEWEWQSQHQHLDSPGTLKNFHALTLNQSGDCTVSMASDPGRPSFISPVYNTSGVTVPWQKIPFPTVSTAVSVALSGKGQWQLDGFTLHFNPLGV